MEIVNYYNDDIIKQIEQVIDENLVKNVNKRLIFLMIFCVFFEVVSILVSMQNKPLLSTISISIFITILLLYMILTLSSLTEKKAKIFYREKLIEKNMTKVYKWDDKNFVEEIYNDKQWLSKRTIPLNQISNKIIENKILLFTNGKLLTIIIIDDDTREKLKQS